MHPQSPASCSFSPLSITPTHASYMSLAGQKIIRGRIFVTHTTREWDINHPGAPAERENSPHLKERSVRSRTTSPPFTWQSRIPHSLRTHLTVFVYNVLLLYPPTLQSSSSLTVNADSQFPQFELGKEALRPPGSTLDERWGGGGRCAT